MPGLRYVLVLAIAFATSACAEIEFGVPAGGAAAGGAGAGGGETLVGGGGGSPPTGEQCLNGVDDDNDGLADCADDDCGEVSCVDVPPGWLGPVELRADDSVCEGTFSQGIASLKTNLVAPIPSCTCTCDGAIESCDSAEIVLYAQVGCGTPISAVPLDNAQCGSLPGAQGTDSYLLTPEKTGGGCTSGVVADLPPPSFDARRLCGLPAESAGCDSGTCAPSSTCVYMPGNVVCPNGFGTPFMGNAGLIDSRACSEGSCGCGQTGGCTFVLELFENATCQDVVDATSSSMCETFSFSGGAQQKGALYTATAAPVSCSTTGSATATGSVTLNEPLTVCCAL